MGFISFNLKYFKDKTEYFENNVLNAEDIYNAKQLLKIVDDLIDEGYDDLYEALQREFYGVDRLKKIIMRNGAVPFNGNSAVKEDDFCEDGQELTEYIDRLIVNSTYADGTCSNADIADNKSFAEYIGYDKDTAYIFLLRDTLLSYIVYRNMGAENIYPWLISRKFFDLLYPHCGIDDIIRSCIFEALEMGHKEFVEFNNYCKRTALQKLTHYPAALIALKEMLNQIPCNRITVIETGCAGTFPMLLSALDERVDFKMYTTYPYLCGIYRDRIYTTAYEKIRQIETLACHDRLFKLAEFKDNKFYVCENSDRAVVNAALHEISSLK